MKHPRQVGGRPLPLKIAAWIDKRLPRGPDRLIFLYLLFVVVYLAAGEICCDLVSQDYVAPGDGWP